MEDPKQLVYKDVASPVGLVRAIASNKGLVAIIWEGEDYKRTKLSVPVKDDKHPILIQTEKELNEYFNNKRTTFDIPLDFKGTEFQIRVWEALLKIPYGVTKTYGDLARILGDIKAVRAVGGALNKNPISIIVPCHRVVGTSGNLVGFAGGLNNKSILLDLEQGFTMPSLF
ncbi:methylated-DNA--[protein]-cysteine S-methyltransferase [Elizabethkingia meningoseptica]|uniref:methylated-DNA--[protein]-cysteine S-methyltransferase n=1 Tax=Elizabethkingia meningoseptica TaxID=238 RepID=UPI0009996710|nr:methylated-DNA--[protein]-cysteine S-methyltransferase [Elizabethkingia meningoseptica]MDE5429581.1 methylated-DNA--[protein]-cysteine S-methyltransferase [Elizabethkingia meningoseptica]MDE5436518.1 methylated-DNA--[protein]-cysteine S-methyltransferase [Elizabethkingia meningoseptica]MDE5492405.1 methylated-DNA--[protein]-cysteine S-methyltransferase [Elizabethkingia meningoseptica]MDE5508282.1 methylated-DNA--[protein]-cysteine S-methyltransferase [Elizabethkingia meningoseptica]MDE55149